MAAAQDRSPGVRFHVLAARLEDGSTLSNALSQVPDLVPPAVAAMLKAGARLGNLRGVLPACRQVLQDGASAVQSATNYAIALLLAFSPAAVGLTLFTYVFVLPKFQAILQDMESIAHPALGVVLKYPALIMGPQIVLFLLLMAGALFYVGGPRLLEWTRLSNFPWADWLAWKVPWKRHRLQRTFSVMLSSLLDGQVPEAEAVRLAADCTANEIVRRRARQVEAGLARGISLADAFAALDAHGEFRWRLRNAVHGRSFLAALRGWHETLEARAFREEQTAAHLITTGMVILNGSLVVLVALATFGSLVGILEAGVLW